MFIDRSHPMLRGCRLLAVPDGRGPLRNLMGVGADGTVQNDPTPKRLGATQGLTFAQASTQSADFGDMDTYGLTGPSLTVIARAKPTAIGTTDDEAALVESSNGGNTAGFLLLFSDFGGAEVGWCFVVRGAGPTFLLANDGVGLAILDIEHVVAGRYDATTRAVSVFIDGDHRHTNADTGTNWAVATSDPLYVGRHAAGLHFDGDVGFVAVFDRALSDAEIAAFSRDWQWPFVGDDGNDGVLFPDTFALYASESALEDVYQPLGAVTYATAVQALAFFGGSFEAGPGGGGEVTYQTLSRTGDTYLADVPEFVVYSGLSHTSDAYSPRAPAAYATLTYTSDKLVGLVEGRRDLIDTFRFRR